MFQDVCDRVRTMALVHEQLYASEGLAEVDFAEYTRSLLDYLWRAHGRAADHIRPNLDLRPVVLPMDQAVSCGLLLNEVTTNALKHAFQGRTQGEVAVALHQSPDGRVHLGVRDDGVGLPANTDWRQSRTLGLRLIQMLAGQLNGTVDWKCDRGTEFQISFGPACSSNGAGANPLPPAKASAAP
jgi:two-component sensor histidine kinase